MLLEGVLFNCDIQTVAHAALVSKQFCRVAVSQSLWLRICLTEFKDTDPTQWLSPEGNLPTYRSVYRLLCSYKPLIGLWSLAKAEKGKLLELYWESDSIAGNQLSYEHMRSALFKSALTRIEPLHTVAISSPGLEYGQFRKSCRANPERSSLSKIGPDGQTVPEPLGKKQLVIRKFAPSYSRPPSRAAESAAAVACFGVMPLALSLCSMRCEQALPLTPVIQVYGRLTEALIALT